MAFVVFLRGVNVGGHKAFQPSVLAKELADFDVVSVGAAGAEAVLPKSGSVMFCAVCPEARPAAAPSAISAAGVKSARVLYQRRLRTFISPLLDLARIILHLRPQ